MDRFVWLVLLVIFCIAEAVTVGLVSIWFAVGAAVALIAAVFTDNILVQVILFLAVSFAVLIVMRPLARKHISPKQQATNADRAIGAEGVVAETIDNLAAQGQVFVLGTVWTARAAQEHGVIQKGETVTVLRIEGVKLIVSPVAANRKGEDSECR